MTEKIIHKDIVDIMKNTENTEIYFSHSWIKIIFGLCNILIIALFVI